MTGTITPPRRPPARAAEQGTGREDPRMARRREDVQAAARRRRRIVAAVVAALVALSAAAVGVLRSPLLDVDRVSVAGSTSVDADAVRRASGIDRGDALVDVDLGAARRAVMALPGVASARVARDWPGTVRISVTDEVALAVLVVDDRRTVIGRGGRVLGPAAGDDGDGGGATGAADGAAGEPVEGAGLPQVAVEDTSIGARLATGDQVPEELDGLVVVLEQLPEQVRFRLGTVELARDGAVTFVLADDAGRVILGRPEEVPAKLLTAASLLAGARLDCLDVLDVREPGRPTISRRAGCDPGAPTVGASTTVPTTTTPKGTGGAGTKKGTAGNGTTGGAATKGATTTTAAGGTG
ncbi:cell division protein FtsQ/DivIB [Dermatobacter hominis]|uniref:cell division protein FtsQ/DivIB n=1 Tax=Dermatobacter hominis TaxID=2884263 RepID=UPI001D10F0E9|nr:FtsQ-type POTRA domain-containing protein [Dermatobacter hominis]UDY35979.1 FtsQ-type POTRA domain-containing protein [Dermatobacter hominis]